MDINYITKKAWVFIKRNPAIVVGGSILLIMIIIALLAPLLLGDPLRINPINRLKWVSEKAWFGTDDLGRDLFTRTLWGGRISLIVGLTVAILSSVFGLALGLLSGFFHYLDGLIMRIMDGIMAIPAVLVAIGLVALTGASLKSVIIAIMIPEIPRIARLVRSVVLSLREALFVDAAIASGTPIYKVLLVHIVPNSMPPLIVQTTFVCAHAIIIEAILSFLGVGVSPEIPTWGTIISEGRRFFQIAPWIIFFPATFLACTVLAVNLLGDGLRDRLDPKTRGNLG